MKDKIVAVSGGFDPIHSGHVRYIQDAALLGKVIVFLNSDSFLKRKKGYVFMTEDERRYILSHIKNVWAVVDVIDKDQSVKETLRHYKPDIFAKGGDRTLDNIPEKEICEELGIEMVFNVGGGKIASSSDLIERCIKEYQNKH